MGASQIADSELTSLSVKIVEVTGSGSRKLQIEDEILEQYLDLVRAELDPGFWNEVVGTEQITFVFKHKDGIVEEYDYSEEMRMEIAKLCTEFNGDPLDKTSNLLAYLAKNEFYTEMIKNNYK